jgi:ferredoxin
MVMQTSQPLARTLPAPPLEVSGYCQITSPQARWQAALNACQGVKLIAGGSLTDANIVAQCAAIYASAGVPCVDIAPVPYIIEQVVAGWQAMGFADDEQPLLMVSLPLDPDPHFRKIELNAADCIACGVCTPLCPTEALTLATPPEEPTTTPPTPPLLIDQPMCYGCGRCVPVCPTDALTMLPSQLKQASVVKALAHPAVGAVEIHTRYADIALLPEFMAMYEPLLVGKAIALCFQPSIVEATQWLAFVEWWEDWAENNIPLPIVLQIDGKPMGGTNSQQSAVPAIKEAMAAKALIDGNLPDFSGWITLSGGMNQYTGALLKNYQAKEAIAGMGVGTMARQLVWPWLDGESPTEDFQIQPAAIAAAKGMINSFNV